MRLECCPPLACSESEYRVSRAFPFIRINGFQDDRGDARASFATVMAGRAAPGSMDEARPLAGSLARGCVRLALARRRHDAELLQQSKVVGVRPVSYTHLRAHETVLDLVCRL